MSESGDFEDFDQEEDLSDVEDIDELDEDMEEEDLDEQEGNIDNIDEDEMEGEFDEDKEDEDIQMNEDLEFEEDEKKEEETTNKFTVPFLTKYEYPKIIALRSQQISQRSPVFVDLEELKKKYKKITPIIIAEEEFKQGKLNNIKIKRRLPNGKIEERRLTELKILSFY